MGRPPGRSAEQDDFAVLLRRADAGDEDAFAAIWRWYNPPLLRFLRGLVDEEDAIEVASTVWLEVVRGLRHFEGDARGFRAWLFTIGRHRVIDMRRARDRRPIVDAGREVPAVPDERYPDPAVQAEDGWSTDQAVALIRSLPPDQAEVVLLRVVVGLDVAAVAKLVGKRPGTVRVLGHRGLKRLAQQISETPSIGKR